MNPTKGMKPNANENPTYLPLKEMIYSSPKDPKPMAIEQDGQVDIQTIRDLISKKYLHPY